MSDTSVHTNGLSALYPPGIEHRFFRRQLSLSLTPDLGHQFRENMPDAVRATGTFFLLLRNAAENPDLR